MEGWDISRVTDMTSVFDEDIHNVTTCDPPVGNWNVSHVTSFVSNIVSNIVHALLLFLFINSLNIMFLYYLFLIKRFSCFMISQTSTRISLIGMLVVEQAL